MLNQLNISAFAEIMTDGLALGVVVLDKACRVILWNRWMEKHSNIRSEDILGKNIFEIYSDIRERDKDKYITGCIRKGEIGRAHV